MRITVTKLHGLGNDYLYVDAKAAEFPDAPAIARLLCPRQYGLGADGLILVYEGAGTGEATGRVAARMVMYNADGSRGVICGNGLRGLGKFLFDRGRAGPEMTIATDAGPIAVSVRDAHPERGALVLAVTMPSPRFARSAVPMVGPPQDEVDETCATPWGDVRIAAVHMGNPHCVVLDPPLSRVEVLALGEWFQGSGLFPEGVNVEFIEKLSTHRLRQRTFERGSGETLACGSGAVAAAVTGIRLLGMRSPLDVELLGGTLRVEWPDPAAAPVQVGPAVEVYRAELDVTVPRSAKRASSPGP